MIDEMHKRIQKTQDDIETLESYGAYEEAVEKLKDLTLLLALRKAYVAAKERGLM